MDILRKNKEKILKYFSELKEKRDPDGSATDEEKILFTKLLCFMKEEAKKTKGIDKNYVLMPNDDDKNNEENQDYDVIEKIKNVELSDVDLKYIANKKKKKKNKKKD